MRKVTSLFVFGVLMVATAASAQQSGALSTAAEALGVSRQALYRRMEKNPRLLEYECVFYLQEERFKDAPLRIAIQAGLVPITVGLVAATAYLIARAADQTLTAVAISAATAGLAYFTRIHPLWAFAAAAALGFAGLV